MDKGRRNYYFLVSIFEVVLFAQISRRPLSLPYVALMVLIFSSESRYNGLKSGTSRSNLEMDNAEKKMTSLKPFAKLKSNHM